MAADAPTSTADVRKLAFRSGTATVLELGAGPTIGYLHGMLGNPGPHPFVETLAESSRVVAPSLPGFDGTLADENLRTMHDWVAATSELIDVAGLAGAPMVASSIGAMLALEVAAVRPEAFERLALIAPFGLWDDDDPVADAFATTLSGQRAMITVDPETSEQFFSDPDGLDPDQAIEAGVDRYLARTSTASLVWPIPEFGLRTRIHRVTCPVTLIWGADDQIVPPSYADRFAAALGGATDIHIIDNAGHQAEWDAPQAVAKLS